MRIAEIAWVCGSALTVLKRRWCWHPGHMLALCNTVALQCGHTRVAPTEFGRATLIGRLLAAVAHGTGLDPAFFILPAKLDVAAHARTGRNGDRTCLDVADDDAA